MRKIYQLLTLPILAALVAACGGEAKEENMNLAAKKSKLDSLKGVFAELKAQIDVLEDEVAELDPDLKSNDILVEAVVPGKKEFVHLVSFRGSVMSRKDVTISAEAMGVAQAVNVREGDRVQQGQLLVKLDAAILESSISEVETQLELAEVVYQRQKKLWDKNIGTEIQYLESKSNYESLKARKAGLDAQLDQTRVRAPFSGTVDQVSVKVGEMVQPGLPVLRLVNPGEMHIMADVSEDYLGKFKKGDEVTIEFPGEEGSYESTVRSVGNVLNTNNRTFVLEVGLPNTGGFDFRPNQVAILKIADYKSDKAVVIPSKVILSGKEGKFVYVVDKSEGKNVARKRTIDVGRSTSDNTEILSGLMGNEQVIIAGYREVSDNANVRFPKEVASN